jgi:drug/metabolite transporter (DMT)-like permease
MADEKRKAPGGLLGAIPLPSALTRLKAAGGARWGAMAPNAQGALLVSLGSLTLVFMAALVKHLGQNIPALEILFFRSLIGFLLVLPVFMSDPMEPFRTRRQVMHFWRGAASVLGNFCFFWSITHMLLADAMAIQFSRPLFMIPLAILFLGEVVGARRLAVTIVGFLGIVIYARPFTDGFDPGAFIAAMGAFGGALVVICIKKLATTEPTRVIMFYYAFWNIVFASIPAYLWWVWPTWWEFALLILVGILGIGGQSLITHGFTKGDTTALVPLDYSRIVYSAIIAYLIFGEVPGLWSLAGMTLIVGASLYLVLTEEKRKK